ncbi:uncharacterized protein [Elaeis guineensis]|uniref:Uncharacterized protein LOC114914688 n=1 Tax=Elaeis guineensis var. tenera TaxID=51953 RepID=A0A8N4F8R6_ELAGV|nr:uncharacterized protein LOC114914688 [Elaeis guineensis]
MRSIPTSSSPAASGPSRLDVVADEEARFFNFPRSSSQNLNTTMDLLQSYADKIDEEDGEPEESRGEEKRGGGEGDAAAAAPASPDSDPSSATPGQVRRPAGGRHHPRPRRRVNCCSGLVFQALFNFADEVHLNR